MHRQRTLFYEKLNTNRKRRNNEEKHSKRLKLASSKEKKKIYGWDQINHMAYHEAPLSLANIKGRCVGKFSRDFLFQWIQ